MAKQLKEMEKLQTGEGIGINRSPRNWHRNFACSLRQAGKKWIIKNELQKNESQKNELHKNELQKNELQKNELQKNELQKNELQRQQQKFFPDIGFETSGGGSY